MELFVLRLREEVLFIEIDFGDEAFGFGIRIDGGKPRTHQNDSGIRPVAVDEIKQFLRGRRICSFRRKIGFFFLLFRIFGDFNRLVDVAEKACDEDGTWAYLLCHNRHPL